VLSPTFLFMSTISLDSFLTILCRLSKLHVILFNAFFCWFTCGRVSKSPLLGGCCVSFFVKEIAIFAAFHLKFNNFGFLKILIQSEFSSPLNEHRDGGW
jgi:hypothetical protein